MAELVEQLDPLLVKYNVDAYFAGHDHAAYHMQRNSIDYFISGAGAMTDKTVSTLSQASTKWYGVGYSSIAVGSVSSTHLRISYYNLEGNEIYSFQKEKTAISYWKTYDKESNFTQFN